MAKHLTPIVGLAVVVALALAAVFGSMSLANPAMAAIGQPADAELTERAFDAQATDVALTATGAPVSVVLRLTVPDGVTGIDSWDYRQSENAAVLDLAAWQDATASANTGDVTITIDTLINGTTYYFKVRALDGSDLALTTVMASATPGAAANGDVDITSASGEGLDPGQVKVEWTFADDATDPVDPTGWEYSKDVDTTDAASIAASEWMDTGLSIS